MAISGCSLSPPRTRCTCRFHHAVRSPEASDATLCHELVHATIDTSAAYLRNWMAALRHDPTMLVQAAAQAQRAADYIQYLQPKAGV